MALSRVETRRPAPRGRITVQRLIPYSVAQPEPSLGTGVATTDVPVVALDDLLPDLGVASVDLINVDTETTEPEVLAGGARYSCGIGRTRSVRSRRVSAGV
jgi:FkbM family methyltransferase